MRSYGMKEIVIRNLRDDAKQCKFKSEEEVLSEIERCKQDLDDAKVGILEAHKKANACNHKFGPSSFTIQRMVVNYVTVYKRVCKLCKYQEFVTVSDSQPIKPDWAEGQYYNLKILCCTPEATMIKYSFN